MGRESANQALRQVRTLYTLGSVGDWTDTQLIERFLGGKGFDREEAFAALVQRHGPMVLRVCRRMLAGSPDADDAFQAVFFVLARKARAIRRTDGLKSWLYGVAVRTAKEARRRSAKRRAREGGAMDVSRVLSAPDQGRDDRLALLDEEIARLPGRYRDPLLLCELEGTSRQDAARRLGIPEGTLSSRLARGRSLLRDRLARRGVALGAGSLAALLPDPASAALPASLADTTVRLSLEFAAGGAVPTAVASLAEGVLSMFTAAETKMTLSILSLAAAACLTAGLAFAIAPGPAPPAPEAKPPAVVAKADDSANGPKKVDASQVVARGVVVDEAGRPVSGIEVWAEPYAYHEVRGVSDEAGTFAIPIRRPMLDGRALLARSADGARLGLFKYGYDLTKTAAQTPVRIVLKPSREVIVRVADGSQVPVPGATVEVCDDFVTFDHATTGPDGSVRLRVPADAKVEQIMAKKSGVGFDFAEYGPTKGFGGTVEGVPAREIPNSIALTLDGSRTVRIKAIDRDGNPLSGVGLHLWLLPKEGRRSMVNFASRISGATTGADGIATFDWLPPARDGLAFFPDLETYAHRRILSEEGATGMITARLVRNETIRGRVTRPDGSPAPGLFLRAYGSGFGTDHGIGRARTNADGSYEMEVSPDEAYAVFVEDEDWAAPARLDVVVRQGKPVDGVDFRLARGTIIRGTVTVGRDRRPLPEEHVGLDEIGIEAPKDLTEKDDSIFSRGVRQVRRHLSAKTDAEGRYSLRVGPGRYTLTGPTRQAEKWEISVGDEAELVRDFHPAHLDQVPISGKVVSGPDGEGVAGALVHALDARANSLPSSWAVDAQGRLRGMRPRDAAYLVARSRDGSLGAIVKIEAATTEIVIPVSPTAKATGILVDERGKPAPKYPVQWARVTSHDGQGNGNSFAYEQKVVTDEEGRFTLPGLIVGQDYEIIFSNDLAFRRASAFRVEKAGTIELGIVRAGVDGPDAPPAK